MAAADCHGRVSPAGLPALAPHRWRALNCNVGVAGCHMMTEYREYVNVLQPGVESMPLIIGCGAAYITMSFICAPYVATMLEISWGDTLFLFFGLASAAGLAQLTKIRPRVVDM